jgi:hypothetical protein
MTGLNHERRLLDAVDRPTAAHRRPAHWVRATGHGDHPPPSLPWRVTARVSPLLSLSCCSYRSDYSKSPHAPDLAIMVAAVVLAPPCSLKCPHWRMNTKA